MFESIGIRRINHANVENPVDIGFIVESMLFYKKVRVLADHVVLKKLVRDIDSVDLIELLERGYLEIEYIPNGPGITHATTSHGELKTVVLFGLVKEVEELVNETIFKKTKRRGFSRRNSNRIASLIKTSTLERQLETEINQDFQNQEYLTRSIKSLLSDLVPEYKLSTNLKFIQHKTTGGFLTETNLDFNEINKIYHKYVPPSHSTITDAYLMSHLANVRTEIHIATKYSSEIATDYTYSHVMKLLINDVIDKLNKNSERIETFQEFAFDNGKDIRSVINSGEKNMRDVIKVLEHADKFKGWLGKIGDEKDLIKEYYKEVTAPNFVDKLPTKSVRWALFTGVGLALDTVVTGGLGTIAGIALSAADSFLLDKLVHKWRPNQFVDVEFKKLIQNKQ